MPDSPTDRLLGETLVRAIDAYFDARSRLVSALVAGDEAAAQAANQDSRAALGTWLALLVERLDSRNAAVLVDVIRRVENLEALMGVDRRADGAAQAALDAQDHGHDEPGRP